MSPMVSVVIPVHDAAAFVADAVASVREQSRPPDEIIVVDDASTDGSGEIAAALGADIRVIRHERNQTLPGARNTGVEACTGDIVVFLDADDLWAPDKTERQLALLDEHPDVSIVVGRTHKMRRVETDDSAGRFELWGEPELLLSMGAAAIRRPAFDRVGRYDLSLAFTCDWDWFMRARELGVPIRTHTDVVQYYRRHEHNLTEDADHGNRDTLAMLRKSLGRRRAAAGGKAESLPGLDSA